MNHMRTKAFSYPMFTSCIYYFRFCAAILAFWLVLDLFYFHYLVALYHIQEKSTKRFRLLRNGIEISGLGGIHPYLQYKG